MPTPREAIDDVLCVEFASRFDTRTRHRIRDNLLRTLSEAGIVLVPREPTEEMLTAGMEAARAERRKPWADKFSDRQNRVLADAYRAMVGLPSAPKETR